MALTPDQRKAKIKSRKGLQRRIARCCGVSEPHVSRVVAGEREGSPPLKRAIARALKLPVDEVFPPPPEQPEGPTDVMVTFEVGEDSGQDVADVMHETEQEARDGVREQAVVVGGQRRTA